MKLEQQKEIVPKPAGRYFIISFSVTKQLSGKIKVINKIISNES
jgi:hypothetical protein